MKTLKIYTLLTLASVALAPIYTKLAIADELLNPHEGGYLGATSGISGKGANIERNPAPGRFSLGSNSAGFGIVGGYNWMFSERFLIGLEGDVGFAGGDTTKSDPTLGSVTTAGNFIGSIRGRAGVAWESALFYGTAGLAFSDISTRPTSASKKNEFRAGVVFGGGIEYALNEDWTARLEGLVYSFGDDETKYTGSARKADMGVATIRLGILKRF